MCCTMHPLVSVCTVQETVFLTVRGKVLHGSTELKDFLNLRIELLQTEDLEALRPLSKILIPVNLKMFVMQHFLFGNPQSSAVANSAMSGISPGVATKPQPSKFVDSRPATDKIGQTQIGGTLNKPEVEGKTAEARAAQVLWRQKELKERQSFLKHFWYAAGEIVMGTFKFMGLILHNHGGWLF